MKRRSFFASLAGIAAAPVVVKALQAPAEKPTALTGSPIKLPHITVTIQGGIITSLMAEQVRQAVMSSTAK